MTKEQYEKIKDFKVQFNQAKSNFVRMSRGELETVKDVYNEVFNAHYASSNLNCNACVLKMLKAMGEAVEKYEEAKERFQKKEETPKPVEKKGPGRPKKK